MAVGSGARSGGGSGVLMVLQVGAEGRGQRVVVAAASCVRVVLRVPVDIMVRCCASAAVI